MFSLSQSYRKQIQNPPNDTVIIYMHSSIETAPPCKILEQSDHYSWRYCISKIWGIQDSVISECSLGVNLVIDNFFDVASDSLPLYTI